MKEQSVNIGVSHVVSIVNSTHRWSNPLAFDVVPHRVPKALAIRLSPECATSSLTVHVAYGFAISVPNTISTVDATFGNTNIGLL